MEGFSSGRAYSTASSIPIVRLLACASPTPPPLTACERSPGTVPALPFLGHKPVVYYLHQRLSSPEEPGRPLDFALGSSDAR